MERVTVTLERAFNLDHHVTCVFLGQDGEHGTEYRRVQCRHLLIVLCRKEVDTILVGLGFIPIPEQTAQAPVS